MDDTLAKRVKAAAVAGWITVLLWSMPAVALWLSLWSWKLKRLP